MAIRGTPEHSKPSDVSIPLVGGRGQESSGFRPIHYLGSKLRALNVIESVLLEVSEDGSRVLDLFAGSGAVAQYLSKRRPVTAVDIQEYSRVLCSALLFRSKRINFSTLERAILGSHDLKLLNDAAAPLIDLESSALLTASHGNAEMLCELIESGSIVRREREQVEISNPEIRRSIDKVITRLKRLNQTSVITRHYGGIYFSYRQAAFMDSVLNFIRRQNQYNKDMLMSCLLSTASHTVNSVGKQFAQPIKLVNKEGKIKYSLMSKILTDRHVDADIVYFDWVRRYGSLNISEYGHRVLRADYAEALDMNDQSIGVVYADPPYTRDHYSRFYHVLETISLDDDPILSRVNVGGKRKLSRGLYRVDRYQSPFCIRSQAPAAFIQLFKSTANMNAPLVLSYSPYSEAKKSHPRVITLELLKQLGSEYFGELEVRDVSVITHSKLNRTDLSLGKVGSGERLLIFTNPYHNGN